MSPAVPDPIQVEVEAVTAFKEARAAISGAKKTVGLWAAGLLITYVSGLEPISHTVSETAAVFGRLSSARRDMEHIANAHAYDVIAQESEVQRLQILTNRYPDRLSRDQERSNRLANALLSTNLLSALSAATNFHQKVAVARDFVENAEKQRNLELQRHAKKISERLVTFNGLPVTPVPPDATNWLGMHGVTNWANLERVTNRSDLTDQIADLWKDIADTAASADYQRITKWDRSWERDEKALTRLPARMVRLTNSSVELPKVATALSQSYQETKKRASDQKRDVHFELLGLNFAMPPLLAAIAWCVASLAWLFYIVEVRRASTLKCGEGFRLLAQIPNLTEAKRESLTIKLPPFSTTSGVIEERNLIFAAFDKRPDRSTWIALLFLYVAIIGALARVNWIMLELGLHSGTRNIIILAASGVFLGFVVAALLVLWGLSGNLQIKKSSQGRPFIWLIVSFVLFSLVVAVSARYFFVVRHHVRPILTGLWWIGAIALVAILMPLRRRTTSCQKDQESALFFLRGLRISRRALLIGMSSLVVVSGLSITCRHFIRPSRIRNARKRHRPGKRFVKLKPGFYNVVKVWTDGRKWNSDVVHYVGLGGRLTTKVGFQFATLPRSQDENSGSSLLFAAHDIGDFSFFTHGGDSSGEIAVKLRGLLSEHTRNLLINYHPRLIESQYSEIQNLLARDLNRLLAGPSIYDEKQFTGVRLRAATQKLLNENAEGADLIHLNRLLLEDVAPKMLNRHRRMLRMIRPPDPSLLFGEAAHWRKNQPVKKAKHRRFAIIAQGEAGPETEDLSVEQAPDVLENRWHVERKDILDLGALVEELKEVRAPALSNLVRLVENRQVVRKEDKSPPNDELLGALMNEMNVLIDGKLLSTEAIASDVNLSRRTRDLVRIQPNNSSAPTAYAVAPSEMVKCINRLVLSDFFPRGLRAERVPRLRVALSTAGWAFEEAAVAILIAKKFGKTDIEQVCGLLLAGIAHDTIFKTSVVGGRRSFRLFDLLAGVSVRFRRDEYLDRVLEIIDQFGPAQKLVFQSRVEKWHDVEGPWRKRWRNRKIPLKWSTNLCATVF